MKEKEDMNLQTWAMKKLISLCVSLARYSSAAREDCFRVS